HLHLDHISGMPDVPKDIPIYTGHGEPEYSSFVHTVVQGTADSLLEGRPALREFQFTRDPDGKFEGVIDVFGDSSFFAIQTRRHPQDQLHYLARTPTSPVLLTGDTAPAR